MIEKTYFSLGLLSSYLLLFGSLTLLAGCKGQTDIESYWTDRSLEVDGDMADWAGIETAYFEDNNTLLGLCNDSDRLYILFRFSDQTYARLIRMGGLTVWLDNTAGKKKDFDLRYTGGSPLSELQDPTLSGSGGFMDRLTEEQKERLKKRETAADQINVVNKKGEVIDQLPVDGSRGPTVAYADLKNIYTYEFSIPLRTSDPLTYGIDSQPGDVLSLGLEWGPSEEQLKRMRGAMMGGPPGGGMGGGGRGGGGTRGGPRGMRDRPQMPEKQEIWVKTVMATPSNGHEETSTSNP